MKEFLNRQVGTENLDLRDGRDLEYYLELTKDYKSDFPPFKIKRIKNLHVIDEAEMGLVGTKARFGDWMMSQIKEKEIVYCQPRVGWAGISLSYLAKKYDKRLTLFMPASREASEHQLVCVELGATPIFRRIAAMSNLQRLAARYAEEKGAFYVPFGLKHPMVTAGAVRTIYDMFKFIAHKPIEMWTVISTGVLTRSLQIALPDTEFFAIAVARNIQQGELGRANFITYHKAFLEKADFIPTEFDSAENYDAKGWEYAVEHAKPGAFFFNVAGNVRPVNLKPKDIDSYRGWGDIR